MPLELALLLVLADFDVKSNKKCESTGSFTFCGQRNLNQDLLLTWEKEKPLNNGCFYIRLEQKTAINMLHRACPLFTNLGRVVTHYPYDLSVFGRVSAKTASWDTVFTGHISQVSDLEFKPFEHTL